MRSRKAIVNLMHNRLGDAQHLEVGKDEVLGFVKDMDYASFIEGDNGGFYFNGALLLYGFGNQRRHSSFIDMNLLLNSKYRVYIGDVQYFGCDLFGNQFGFARDGICFLNIETATYEIIADSFSKWLKVMEANTDYYTCQSLLLKWENQNRQLQPNERLCPKLPFVLGGEYAISNLYALNLEKLIEYNAYIASQIYDLPDGAEVQINVVR